MVTNICHPTKVTMGTHRVTSLTLHKLALISQLLKETYAGIELGSVDGFQGREKEAVVVSLVRSNTEHEVGFLGEKRRLNGKTVLQGVTLRNA